MNSASRVQGRILVASAAAVALTLTGCTPSAQTPSGDGSGDGGGAQTLTVWHYFSDDNQVAILDEYKAMFEEANPDVTVENVFVPYDQLNPRLISSAASSTGPDVVVFNGADMSTLALGNALAPLDDYWADFADADQFPESVIHSLDDTVYAVQGYVNLLGLWYNADVLGEIGVEPPTTIEELDAALTAAVDAGQGGITLSGLPNSQGEWQAYPWLSSFGFTYDDPQREPLVEAFSMIQRWTESGALTREASTWDQTVPFQTFAAGGHAFAENGNWQMGTAESTAEFSYGVVPLPIGAEGGVYLGGEGQAIGAFSEQPDLAWDYLEATYYSEEGGVIAAELVGSIPARSDAAGSEAVTGNDLMAPFADSIASNGTNYPAGVIPPESVADVQLAVGQAWSAVISGQLTPDAAADQVLAALEGLL
ncbi:multiple sugar transport system substrate-binding protein [Microbacterium sp. AK009]|uniref:sugar ABC transporter substrate-binding protein n=1 Tax=Microbacterium sp. AK009 TaxID=2723068 RepID=UPI0015CB0B6B|nr:extracellular solute-binding protein [Microbacterium sp. AK009]NYF15518.1 multiple sugar transport system substrate-binding protein [Microbacterium sp. AK009]